MKGECVLNAKGERQLDGARWGGYRETYRNVPGPEQARRKHTQYISRAPSVGVGQF